MGVPADAVVVSGNGVTALWEILSRRRLTAGMLSVEVGIAGEVVGVAVGVAVLVDLAVVFRGVMTLSVTGVKVTLLRQVLTAGRRPPSRVTVKCEGVLTASALLARSTVCDRFSTPTRCVLRLLCR